MLSLFTHIILKHLAIHELCLYSGGACSWWETDLRMHNKIQDNSCNIGGLVAHKRSTSLFQSLT